MAYDNIIVEKRGRAGLIRLNRPQALNALNTPLINELIAALRAVDHDDGIGATVLTGSDKAFAAGADIKEMAALGFVEAFTREQAAVIVERLRAGAGERPRPSRLLLVLRYEGDERRLADAGFDVQARIGSVYSGLLDPERLTALAALPGLVSAELSRPLRGLASGDPVPPETEPDLQPAQLPTPAGPPAGAGVVVGLVDSGVDIRHRAFRKADGTTRIKFLLDLSNPGDVDGDGKLDGPDEFGGTLYTEAQINRLLASSKPLPTHDPTGHGTLALSIAAGSDSQYPGLAPGAQLIVVKATRRDGTLDFESADLLSALESTRNVKPV